MEPRSGMYSRMQPGALALEMSLPGSPPRRNPSPAAAGDGGHHRFSKQSYLTGAKSSKSSNFVASDDEEEPGNSDVQWQRMKWTDNMVRLLIMVVFYIGDEVVVTNEVNDKKKKQGKGKWKTVSRAMIERGFNLSPQQCEDKFNDLNKRYKRVNDILGKGTACRVVEDQSLLDGIYHLSPKAKESVRKMINSKHLFFREMCAYHNNCSHGNEIPEVDRSRMGKNPPLVENNDNEGEEDEEEEEDDDDDEEEEEEEEGDEIEGVLGKRGRDEAVDSHFPLMQKLEDEVENVLDDGRRVPVEKRLWLRMKLDELEEDQVGICLQALEVEKQRLKWLKFTTKKELEMEKEKLANEQAKLENERMALFVRRQELDLIEQEQKKSCSKSGHFAISG